MSSAPSPPNPTTANSSIATEPFELTLPDDSASGQDWLLWAGVLMLLVFLVFFPAVNGSFLWDDDHHPMVISVYPTLADLGKIWIEQRATPQYYPFTYTTYWIEYAAWGKNPMGYHIDNMLIHGLSAVLVWRLLRRLKLPGAWVAAAVWAVHPVQAESVCWITERKNILSGFLFFSSLWFYTEFAGLAPEAAKPGPSVSADGSTYLLGSKPLAYIASLVLFILALLSKTVACALPAVCLILLWWKGRKLNFKSVTPLIPFFLAGLALACVTVFLETQPGGNVQANGADWALSPLQRILIAGRGVWFYVAKLVWPFSLSFIYPRLIPTAADSLFILAAIALLAFLWSKRNAWGRGPLAAVCFYGVNLVPSLGFINIFPMRYSFVANHYQYLAGLGLIVLAVSAIARLSLPRVGAMVVACIVLLGISVQTWLTAGVFQSSELLWRDTLAKNPNAWMADNNLGIELIHLSQQNQQQAATDKAQGLDDAAADDQKTAQAELDEAGQLFQRALTLRPTDYGSYNGLGNLARVQDKWQDAEGYFRTAAQMDLQDDLVHQVVAPYLNYAQVLQHNHPNADYKLHPDWDPLPWLNAALALKDYRRPRAMDIADAHLAYGDYFFRLAGTASRAGRTQEEIADLQQAIDELETGRQILQPGWPGDLFDLARAYQRLGVIDQAKADAAKAAGHLDEAAQFQKQSLYVDDANSMQVYLKLIEISPDNRHAGAMEGMGELFVHQVIEYPSQPEAINDLLRATEFFIGSQKVDPNVAGATQNLAAMEQKFMDEAAKARDHGKTWAPLLAKLNVLANGSFGATDASAADEALHNALWPLPKNDPLRQPLENLHWSIRDVLSAAPSADSIKALRTQAATVLGILNTRDAAHGAAADLAEAALCYQCAVSADPQSTQAWNDLKLVTDQLAASKYQVEFKDSLATAQSVLSQNASATRPTTMPTTPVKSQ